MNSQEDIVVRERDRRILDPRIYRTCSIKRSRRTNDDLIAILAACKAIINEEGTVSLRHLFYRIVSLGLIEKTEKEYAKLSGYTMKWRRDGSISWSSFVDRTRWYHGVQTFHNLREALEHLKNTSPLHYLVAITCLRDGRWRLVDPILEGAHDQ